MADKKLLKKRILLLPTGSSGIFFRKLKVMQRRETAPGKWLLDALEGKE